MDVHRISEGLWQWTAPHPAWKPENDTPTGWGQMVASVYAEPLAAGSGSAGSPPHGILLIDPLGPPAGTADAERFWKALDSDVERVGRPVVLLLGNEYHSRSIQTIHDRYRDAPGAIVVGPETARGVEGCRITAAFPPQGAGNEATRYGFIPFSVRGLSPAETVYFLPEHRALVVADALLSDGSGRVQVAPASWAPSTDVGGAIYAREMRPSLRPLLDLDFDRLLLSHGASVLEDGRAALARALESPAWGESRS